MRAMQLALWHGARTHKAHLALENAPKLRQFIKAGAAQNAAKRGDPWITRTFISSASTAHIRTHRADLEALKSMSELPDTFICETSKSSL